MKDVQSICELCNSEGTLQRIPQLTSISKPESESARRVKEAIEENRKIFKKLDKEGRTQIYDD
jgi:aspartate ammonia-lyase